jgi:tRNA dimethylallyltransferase
MGPTASGKTALAMALAEALDGELISVDSALVYRGLDIGSRQARVPASPDRYLRSGGGLFSGALCRRCAAAIDAVRGRGRLPILVGGTMLYYRALFAGAGSDAASDPGAARVHRGGGRAARLAAPARASWPPWTRRPPRVSTRGTFQRLLRALEVFRISGVPLSRLQERPGGGLGEPALCVAVAPA